MNIHNIFGDLMFGFCIGLGMGLAKWALSFIPQLKGDKPK